MFYLFYRIYGHFVFRSPQPPPGGERRARCARKIIRAGRDASGTSGKHRSLRSPLRAVLNRRILAWSGKRTLCRRSVKKRGRFACKPAKAPVLAMPNNVPAKATCGWFWVPFATKRYKASAAYAAVKAALPTKKRQTTPVEECKYLLQPRDTQKIPALKTQGFSRRTAKPGAMRPDYRIPYLRRIFRIRGSRSEIMRS